MINLLPQKEKKELLLNFTQKKLFALLASVFFAFLILLGTLFFMKSLLANKQESLKTVILEKQKNFQAVYAEDFKTALEASTNKLKISQGIWGKQVFLSPFFEKLYVVFPSSVYLTNLTAKISGQEQLKTKIDTKRKSGERYFNINMSGFSPTRETLYAFNQSLQKENNFSNATFAISSWMAAIDVDFALNLEFPAPVSAETEK